MAIDGSHAGALTFGDILKENAEQAVDCLREMGMEVIMLTGDKEKTAKAIAAKLGIDRAIAEVLPQQQKK